MSDSVYDRMKEERARQEQEYQESYERAIRKPFAVLQVSKRKARVIKQSGNSAVAYGTRDVMSWVFASEPISYDKVEGELKRLEEQERDR